VFREIGQNPNSSTTPTTLIDTCLHATTVRPNLVAVITLMVRPAVDFEEFRNGIERRIAQNETYKNILNEPYLFGVPAELNKLPDWSLARAPKRFRR